MSFLSSGQLDRIDWSVAAIAGNSPIAKATLFTPIVGQIVVTSKEYFLDQFGFALPLWLYWSLVILFIAQILYFIFCPEIVRKHNGDVEIYVEKGLLTYSETELSRLSNSYVRSFFREFGGSPLNLDLEELPEDNNFYLNRIAGIGNDKAQNRFSTIMTMLSHKENLNPNNFQYISEANFKEYIARLSGRELSVPESRSVQEIHQYLNRVTVEPRVWHTEVLRWNFSEKRKTNHLMVLVTLKLYAFGSLYFLFNFVSNLYKISLITMSSA